MKRVFILFILMLSLLFSGYSQDSVIIQDLPSASTFKVDCLGEDNLIFIYAFDSQEPEGIISYRGDCDIQETLKKQYLENAIRINIRNGEDSDVVINYNEYLNEIEDENANSKIEEFDDKVCVTVITSKFSDIEVHTELQQQTKEFYHCFTRASLNDLPKNDLGDKVILEVLINEKLFREFQVALPLESIKISFNDLALIDEDNKEFINIKFTNPTPQVIKVNVVDTNLGCPSNSFTISDTFSMLCNKTSLDTPVYFIQIKDDLGRFTFKEYQIPPSNDEGGGINIWLVLIVLGVIAYAIYNNYQKDVDKDNESSFDQLEGDKNEK